MSIRWGHGRLFGVGAWFPFAVSLGGGVVPTTKLKLSYAVQLSVAELCRLSKSPVLATLTFAENVVDRVEAEKRYRRLKERLRRRFLSLNAVGVWQRQARGAWHLHLVLDRCIAIEWLRPQAVACGFGTFINLRRIGAAGFRQLGPDRVARYISRYVSRDLPEGDKGARLVAYIGNARRCTVRFGWANGVSKLWRAGRGIFFELFGHTPDFDSYWFVVRLGWETFSSDEKDLMLQSRGVRSWWDPDRYPPDPF